jgi:hypothetical protein
MLAGDKHQHATYEGEHSRVRNARNVPKPIQQPRVPIMVGGNGPNVTWRLAARHADELNLDGMEPEEVGDVLPTIRQRCEEIGRDPATLSVSIHMWAENIGRPGSSGSTGSAATGAWAQPGDRADQGDDDRRRGPAGVRRGRPGRGADAGLGRVDHPQALGRLLGSRSRWGRRAARSRP